MQVDLLLPIPLHCDNKAPQHITTNLVFHERMKHLKIGCHVIRNQIGRGFISTHHIPSRSQLADMFTKPLDTTNFTAYFPK